LREQLSESGGLMRPPRSSCVLSRRPTSFAGAMLNSDAAQSNKSEQRKLKKRF
jgi:hypothetical protein